MSEREVAARQTAMRRRLGMGEEAKEALKEHEATYDGWWATCRACGCKLQGTLKAIMTHRCYNGE